MMGVFTPGTSFYQEASLLLRIGASVYDIRAKILIIHSLLTNEISIIWQSNQHAIYKCYYIYVFTNKNIE